MELISFIIPFKGAFTFGDSPALFIRAISSLNSNSPSVISAGTSAVKRCLPFNAPFSKSLDLGVVSGIALGLTLRELPAPFGCEFIKIIAEENNPQAIRVILSPLDF